ncbi:MAG: hypothetical protein WAO02_11285 [Verrucomicrobiia bacterium]
MKTLWFCTVLGLALTQCPAEDIQTLEGRTYKDISDVQVMSDGIVFSYDTGVSRIKVPYNHLPDTVKTKYHYDPFKEGLFLARQNKPVDLQKSLAFPLDNLAAARQKAGAENKMIGFVVVGDEFFNKPARPMGKGSKDALAQFYTTFHNALVLVFVSHERELNDLPAAAKMGILGPAAGTFDPKMAVTTADCSQLVCFIPYGKDGATGYDRETVFKQKIAELKQFAETASGKSASPP